MRILHVLDHSAPLHSGYSFRTLSILREQRKRGWETWQLTSPRHQAAAGAADADVEHVEGFEFHRTSYRAGWRARVPGGWPFDEMQATSRRLRELVARVQPQIIHAHSPVLNALPAIRIGRECGIPVVYEVRAFWEDAAVDQGSTTQRGLRYRLTRALETWALRRADAVTTICAGLEQEMSARGVSPDRITVIPNAVDIARFPLLVERDQSLLQALGLQGREVIGFCGSFYAYEGLDLLIDALPEILARRPSAVVLLVGGGPQDEMLRRRVTDLRLEAQVRFTGRVPNAEIERYYSVMDVLAFPRRKMRLTDLVTPLKPLEAMAQGRPLVASDVGGHRELIMDGHTGLLFPAGDPRALAIAVVRMLEEGSLRDRIVREGRRFVEEQRTWACSVARYEPVYQRLISHGVRR